MADGDYPPRRFDFGQPAVAQQPFTHDGVDYTPGKPFPYEKLGLDRWQMLGFWQTSRVDFVSAAPKQKPSKHASR